MTPPFRWNLTKREQLGGLVDGIESASYRELIDDLRECCGRIVALSADCDMVFIGRSPESIFDYFSGLLLDTSWATRLTLVNLSLRHDTRGGFPPGALRALREHLGEVHLTPEAIASRQRDVALVDLVATGKTFGELATLLFDWARETGIDGNSVRRRLRFVGITWRRPTSPKTWRWQQHAEWTRQFRPSAIKNVSIEGRLWDYLGNRQQKVATSNPPWRWTDESMLAPPREEEQLKALRLALRLFDIGQTNDHRQLFAACLAKQRAMREPSFRALIIELRGQASRS